MPLLADIHNLKRTFALLLIGAIFLIAPGALTIFIFDQALFESLDVIKLCLLSVSITAPFTMLFAIILQEIDRTKTPQDADELIFTSLILGSLTTGFIWYVSLLIAFISGLRFMHFVFMAIAFETLVFIAILIEDRKKRTGSEK
jgi:uncharacterized membrane protein